MSREAFNNLIDDFNEADPVGTTRGNKIKIAGTHVAELWDIKDQESRRTNAHYLVVEFRLVSTTTNLDLQSEWSWTHDIKNKFYGLPRAKEFLAAALGLSPDSDEAKALTKQNLLDAMSSPDGTPSPLRGRRVNLKTVPSVGETSGRPYTIHEWSPAA